MSFLWWYFWGHLHYVIIYFFLVDWIKLSLWICPICQSSLCIWRRHLKLPLLLLFMDWLSNKNHLFCFLGTLCPLLSLLHCPYCPSRGGPCTTSATSKYRFFKAFLVHTIHLLPIHRIYDIHPSDMLKIEICCHFHFLFYFFNCSRRIDEGVIALINAQNLTQKWRNLFVFLG